MALLEESETNINYDYASQEVEVYTTRRGVYKKIVERIGEKNIPYHGGDLENGWKIRASMKYFRDPFIIARIVEG
jgi:hypothetical protein